MPPNKKRKLDTVSAPELQLTQNDVHAAQCMPDILAEIDLEIGLRQRFLETIEARISWAQVLKDSLLQGGVPPTLRPSQDLDIGCFQRVALNTLATIEHPTRLLFDREALPPPLPHHIQIQREAEAKARNEQATPLKAPRPPPRHFTAVDDVPSQHSPAHHSVASNASPFLYIRASAIDFHSNGNPFPSSAEYLLLKCPSCGRTTFSALQGLLNHARIAHGLEWGTHEECIGACASPYDGGIPFADELKAQAEATPDSDTKWWRNGGIEVGSGRLGVLPGLRSLFRNAVGEGSTARNAHPAANPGENGDFFIAGTPQVGVIKTEHIDSEILPSETPSRTGNSTASHLNRTLGIHSETPALARFLGKQAVRRGIKVFDPSDEGEEIDVFGLEPHIFNSAGREVDAHSRRWRMAFSQRNVINDDEEEMSHLNATAAQTSTSTAIRGPLRLAPAFPPSDVGPHSHVKLEKEVLRLASAAESRFHFTTRIIILDRSQWLPLDKRGNIPRGHTHRWMISVDAPSYAHHITTVLKSVSVVPVLPYSPAEANFEPPTTPKPTASSVPFVVTGTASEPFLASVEMMFSGYHGQDEVDGGQKVVREHWVELDPLHGSATAIGEEQIVDMELHKKTILLPQQPTVAPRSLWDSLPSGPEVVKPVDERGGNDQEQKEGYEVILELLTVQFPLILKHPKGVKASRPQVSYRLVSSLAQYRSLIVGRRKAIEWGRAKAIQEAYTRQLDPDGAFGAVHDDEDESMITSTPDLIERSVGSGNRGSVPLPRLSVGDVYAWLSVHGHFPRVDVSHRQQQRSGSGGVSGNTERVALAASEETWCGVCGFALSVHPEARDLDREGEVMGTEDDNFVLGRSRVVKPAVEECTIAPRGYEEGRLSVLDVSRLLPSSGAGGAHGMPMEVDTSFSTPNFSERYVDVVGLVDPGLVLSVRDVVGRLKLRKFVTAGRESKKFPVDRGEVAGELAPYAVLALAVRSFVGVLVKGGIQEAKRLNGGRYSERQLLTGTHIIQGVGILMDGFDRQIGKERRT